MTTPNIEALALHIARLTSGEITPLQFTAWAHIPERTFQEWLVTVGAFYRTGQPSQLARDGVFNYYIALWVAAYKANL